MAREQAFEVRNRIQRSWKPSPSRSERESDRPFGSDPKGHCVVTASVFAMFGMSVHARNADRLRPASSDSQHTAIGLELPARLVQVIPRAQ